MQSPKCLLLFRKMLDSTKNFVLEPISNLELRIFSKKGPKRKTFFNGKNSTKKVKRGRRKICSGFGGLIFDSREVFKKFDGRINIDTFRTKRVNLENITKELFPSKKLPEQIWDGLNRLSVPSLSREERSQLESELKPQIVSEINQIGSLKGPQIIELALTILSKEKEPDSENQELIELAQQVLSVQVKYLNDEGLVWIRQNHDYLLSLSAETKLLYRKICHQMLEDEKITPQEEELMIKFINQGFTHALTRSGEIIFEGKHYKLKGIDIESALEKIAKNIINQQQDILACQYKENEPIFLKSNHQGGMKEAAADKKDVRSIVDSRFQLKNDSWLLTTLQSLKFKSEIIILEKRSAFGDHFIYHFSGHKFLRFYPNEPPPFKETFGSYIFRETYQGEVKELTDEVGQKLFESKDKNQAYQIQGNILSRQKYFQQELLREGSEDRNQTTEEDLAKKLDDNNKLLQENLEELNLSGNQRLSSEEYYEGLVSTISSVYTSSQAIAVGKVAIDDGTDYFSFVNLFIQLTSLDPLGIGDIVATGLNAVRSYLVTTPIKNEANFVKDITIDAVQLSELSCKMALDLISDPNNRQRIFDAQDGNQATNQFGRIKDWILGEFDKLKNKMKEFPRLRNLFLQEIKRTPAFQLGVSDAHKIIKGWIELRQSQPDLRLSLDEKQKRLTEIVTANTLQTNPPNKKKPGCCKLF